MGIQVVRIEVDVHEPRRIREELGQLGADVDVAGLPVGDYRTGLSIVERKTVRNLHLTEALNHPHYAYRSRRSRERQDRAT